MKVAESAHVGVQKRCSLPVYLDGTVTFGPRKNKPLRDVVQEQRHAFVPPFSFGNGI